ALVRLTSAAQGVGTMSKSRGCVCAPGADRYIENRQPIWRVAILSCILCALLTLSLAGCAGLVNSDASHSNPQRGTVGVTVTPPSASVQTGGTQQCSATVTGTSNSSVVWSATGGTISSAGLYTAGSSAGTFAVTATSGADTSKKAQASVTITSAPPPPAPG